ncbi:pyridoxamine 5'-phosphate oxidase family protein [Plantactinospora sp. B6F1]|uniref:pyridoxamine 5'-phosphate oxidase family protein n=1 Tax=Plantactinospora sp. B6F1 TaxID=3158971 RepID=UPI0032D8CF59
MLEPHWLDEIQRETFVRASPGTEAAYPAAYRMTGTQIEAYLRSGCNAVVATTRPNGRPHAVPTGVTVHEHAAWLPVSGGAVRSAHLTAHPWASVVLIEGSGVDHRLVILEGDAELVTGPLPEVAATNRGGRDMSWASHWIRLRPRKVFSFTGAGTGD